MAEAGVQVETSAEEHELLERLRAGDERAFEALVELDQMRTTVATFGRVTEDEVPPETRERLLGAFREWKHS